MPTPDAVAQSSVGKGRYELCRPVVCRPGLGAFNECVKPGGHIACSFVLLARLARVPAVAGDVTVCAHQLLASDTCLHAFLRRYDVVAILRGAQRDAQPGVLPQEHAHDAAAEAVVRVLIALLHVLHGHRRAALLAAKETRVRVALRPLRRLRGVRLQAGDAVVVAAQAEPARTVLLPAPHASRGLHRRIVAGKGVELPAKPSPSPPPRPLPTQSSDPWILDSPALQILPFPFNATRDVHLGARHSGRPASR
eukprot:gene7160-biopygen10958